MAYLKRSPLIKRTMVQIAPNKSSISATVLALETYAAQMDFYLLHLGIKTSKKVTGQLQMPGAEKAAKLKAIVSKTIADELKLVKGSRIECELKKVSIDLWRIGTLSIKSATKKKK